MITALRTIENVAIGFDKYRNDIVFSFTVDGYPITLNLDDPFDYLYLEKLKEYAGVKKAQDLESHGFTVAFSTKDDPFCTPVYALGKNNEDKFILRKNGEIKEVTLEELKQLINSIQLQ